MAFFEEIGKKLSQAGQNAMQKTKDFTDITKLNGLISAEEKKMNNAVSRLGRAYYEAHSEDYEAACETVILEIKEAQKNIASLRQQVQDIKKVARCECCGAEIPNDAAFCSSCGAPAPKRYESEVAGTVMCPNCRQMIPADSKFCVVCGNPMDNSASVMMETQPQEMSPVMQSEQPAQYEQQPGYVVSEDVANYETPAEISYEVASSDAVSEPAEEVSYDAPEIIGQKLCPNCNAEILPDMVFCTNCGTRVE